MLFSELGSIFRVLPQTCVYTVIMITASRKRYTPTAALLKRSSGLWQGLNRRGRSTGLWIALHRRADQKPTTAPGLWQNLNQRTDPQPVQAQAHARCG